MATGTDAIVGARRGRKCSIGADEVVLKGSTEHEGDE
jgi:hypothetical protein